MKQKFVWGAVAVAIWFLDDAIQRAYPGLAKGSSRYGPLVTLGLMVLAGWIAVSVLVAFTPWLRRRLTGHSQPYFEPDPADTEQAAADEELERIAEAGDGSWNDGAFQRWLEGERRREEARFVKRRERATASHAAMRYYVTDIRAEIELCERLVDPSDPHDSARGDVTRLREELRWAEAELARMPQG